MMNSFFEWYDLAEYIKSKRKTRMPDHKQIYTSEAERYEALVSREDYRGNIQRALDEIVDVNGLDILDVGAGTGRLAGLLAPRVRSMLAFDISAGMLTIARDKLNRSGLRRWGTAVGDHRALPIPSRSADVIVSGWSVSYVAVWNPERWREELNAWFAEAERVLRRGGFIVLFESLGTGNESPQPLAHLENTYRWLDEAGFQNKWIRTDYRFESLDEAVDLAGFFFGEAMADQVRERRSVVLPECTGVWWRKV
jgi:ubiquinone/menaquinone biosynthesis C-methylase UbiE